MLQVNKVFLVQDRLQYNVFDLHSRRFITEEAFDKVHAYRSYLQVWKNGKLFYIRP